jgi:signal transduction histidine kinase
MTIKKVFRLMYFVFFIFMLAMAGMLITIYINQQQIEANALLTELQDRDLQQSSQYIQVLAGLVVLLVILLVLLYRIVNSRIAAPLNELLAQTRMVQADQNRLTEMIIEISTGNLEAGFTLQAGSLKLKHVDEFNELAVAHNLMAENLSMTGSAIASILLGIKTARDKLSDVNLWLEKTVEERTRDLREANAQLEQAHSELSSLDKAKSAFLRMVSHEIRTPLNGIQGFTYLLRDMPQAPEVAEIFDLLEVSVKRLERFSKVALLITELQAGNHDIHRDQVSAGELIMPVLKLLDQKIREKNLNIVTDGEMELAEIRGDMRMLPMCVQSILDNAITYSDPGGMIHITAVRGNGIFNIEFRDHGRGFSEDALRNLFKTFSPGEEHIDENVGLDLALAKMIMDAHGGTIGVGNNQEGGARVVLGFAI